MCKCEFDPYAYRYTYRSWNTMTTSGKDDGGKFAVLLDWREAVEYSIFCKVAYDIKMQVRKLPKKMGWMVSEAHGHAEASKKSVGNPAQWGVRIPQEQAV